MIDVTRNGHIAWQPQARMNGVSNEEKATGCCSSSGPLEAVKARVVDFVTQKPGTSVVAGVLLGAALAWLVVRRKG